MGCVMISPCRKSLQRIVTKSERFAERAKRQALHPVHKETIADISKDFLRELIRGVPKL